MDDQRPPWLRQPGEPSAAYAAFRYYFQQGPIRSMVGTIEYLQTLKGDRRTPPVYKWSSLHNWDERAAAYDEYTHQDITEEQRAIAAAQAKIWAERRYQILEEDFEVGSRFYRRFRSIDLDRLEPKDLRTVAAAWKDASAVRSEAVNRATGAEDSDDGFDVEKATPEECRAYLKGKASVREDQAR